MGIQSRNNSGASFKNKIFLRTGKICSHADGRNENPRKLTMGQTHRGTYSIC